MAVALAFSLRGRSQLAAVELIVRQRVLVQHPSDACSGPEARDLDQSHAIASFVVDGLPKVNT
jgi:hypothetical protein